MTGTLGLFSLVDLFQLLAAARRSGRLSIDHPRGPAKVFFDKGQVVHAEFEGITGEEGGLAIFVTNADVRVQGCHSAPVVRSRGTENVVLESVRRPRRGTGATMGPQSPDSHHARRGPVRSTQAERAAGRHGDPSRAERGGGLITEQVDGQRTLPASPSRQALNGAA